MTQSHTSEKGTREPVKSRNKKAGDALVRQIAKAAGIAHELSTPAGRDAARSLAEVLREFSLARMGGFNEEAAK